MHNKALFDMESTVCNLNHMAAIAADFIGDNVENTGGNPMTDDAVDRVQFLANQTARMASEVTEAYYRAFNSQINIEGTAAVCKRPATALEEQL